MDQRNLGDENKFLRNYDIKPVNFELLDTNIFQILHDDHLKCTTSH